MNGLYLFGSDAVQSTIVTWNGGSYHDLDGYQEMM